MSIYINTINGAVYNECTIHMRPDGEQISMQRTQADVEDIPTTETVVEKETHFALLTAQCIKEGKAQAIESELGSAAKGSAKKLIQCIRTNEALGYIDTKNMSSQALYDALNAYFGLKYSVRNFTIARNK